MRWRGVLCALVIELHGNAALFPSTSNSKQIYFNKKTGSRFVGKSHDARKRLDLISALFLQEIVTRYNLPIPSFGEFPIHVLALLADRPGRWDSHNYSKPIGDWLQSTGIIDDDTSAEIHCVKKSDFPQPNVEASWIALHRDDPKVSNYKSLLSLRGIEQRGQAALRDTSRTTIIVQLRSSVTGLTERYIHDCFRTAQGSQLIG